MKLVNCAALYVVALVFVGILIPLGSVMLLASASNIPLPSMDLKKILSYIFNFSLNLSI